MNVHSVGDWGELLDRSDILVVDTETTGAGKWAEVLDVAVIDTTGAVRFNSAVLPASNIPRDAQSSIHGIELLLLTTEGARPWSECHEAVTDLLKGASTVCVYNAAHDRRVLKQGSIRYGLEFPRDVRWRCLMLDYAAHRQIPQLSGGWERHKLEDAATHEGVLRGEQAHEAQPDCQLTLRLMRAVAGQEANAAAVQPETRNGNRWLRFAGKVVFGIFAVTICVPFAVVMSPLLVPLALIGWWYERKRSAASAPSE